jgi:hypothetical protein
MSAIIQEGIEDGSIENCDVEMVRRAIVGALNWVPHWYDPKVAQGAEDVKKTFVEFLARGLAKDASGVGGRSTLNKKKFAAS